MSKYCRKCQHVLADNARFCDQCGTDQHSRTNVPAQPPVTTQTQATQPVSFPVSTPVVLTAPPKPTEPPVIPVASSTASDSGKPKSKKGLIIGIGIAIALVAILAVVLILTLGGGGGSSGSSKKDDSASKKDTLGTVLDIHTKIASNGKTANLKKVAPTEYWEALEEQMDYTYSEYAQMIEESYADEVRDELGEMYGSNYRFSYKITDETKMGADELEEKAADLEEWYGMDADLVTAAKELVLEVTIRGSEDEDTDELNLYAFCYDGTWYVTNASGNFNVFSTIVALFY